MKIEKKTRAYILLFILIAIGGFVLYGNKEKNAPTRTMTPEGVSAPLMAGPKTPPPSNETLR